MAQAESVNTTSRRSFLAAAAVAGAIGPIAIIDTAPAIADSGGDAALIAKAEQIAELSRRWDVAIERWGECHDRYVEMRGHKQETLLWKPGSPVRQATGQFYHKDGKTYPWCCTDEIEEFRHKTFFQYMFVGPGRMSEQRTSKFLDENWPVEGWERWPDEVRQKRFSKLLADYDEWGAVVRQFETDQAFREERVWLIRG
jgi:hypothetical protein